MNRLNFEMKQKLLTKLIQESLLDPNTSIEKKENLNNLLEVLESYSYDNRMEKKGTLTHIAIDSIYLDFPFINKVVRFDQSL